MTTPYGKAVRKLRIDAGLRLKDMADALGVKSAYLSAVETGKKRNTDKLVDNTISFFANETSISAERASSVLKPLVAQSQPECVITMEGHVDSDRELVAAFARRFSDLSTQQKSNLKSILDME